MNSSFIEDLVFMIWILMLVFFKEIPLEFQGAAGVIYGMLFMWLRVKSKDSRNIK